MMERKKLNKTSFLSSVVMSGVALLLCAAFTFSWLSSKIDYLNTVIQMGDFAATVNVYYEDGSLVTTGATVGDDVVVNNAITGDANWSAGTVGYRFIEVKNTGTISLNSFINLGFDCQNFNCTNEQVTDSFFLRVTDITSSVRSYNASSGKKLSAYIDSYKSATASAIHNSGLSFTDATDIKKMGTTIGGGTSYYLLEYCCYDLSSLYFNSESYLSIGAKIRVQQTAAPVVTDDKEVITGNSASAVSPDNKKDNDNIKDAPQNGADVSDNVGKTEATTTASINNEAIPATSPANSVPTTAPATTTVEPTTQVVETPSTVAPTQPVSLWTIEKLTGNTCKVISYNGDEKDVTIPAQIDNAVVSELGASVFDFTNAEKVKIPATVRNIEIDMFNVTGIKNIEIEKETTVNSVKYTSPYCVIDRAVYSADKTTLIKYLYQGESKKFKIDKDTVTIGDRAFGGAKIKELDLCAVKSISSTAFTNADIESFDFHTSEPPMVASASAFGAVDVTVGDKGEVFKTEVKLHIPEAVADKYGASYGFASYASAKAIVKDGVLGSGTVAVEKTEGLIYTIIENGSEYDGVRYNIEDAKFLAIVTGYEEIALDGVAQIASKIVYNDKAKGYSYACPVVGIADNAFENAKTLKVVVMPNSNIYYTSKAFAGCDNLGLVDFASVIPFDVGKFDAILNVNGQQTTDNNEDEEE